ncbi:hypothetical protein [Streptomyces aquilus]|nr:hypothetical protein [Streptomyces aquilus]
MTMKLFGDVGFCRKPSVLPLVNAWEVTANHKAFGGQEIQVREVAWRFLW